MSEPEAVAKPTDQECTAHRLLIAIRGMAVLAVVMGVGRHSADGILVLIPETGDLSERLAVVPGTAWIFAALHLAAALASLALGYLLVSLAYPRRHLAREAHDNPAAAVQASAHLLGVTVIASVAWGGIDLASLGVSAAFCAIGWLVLILICAGHRAITRYRDHEEVADGNVAAALASAGLHLALALVVGLAMHGPFVGWQGSLTAFGLSMVWVLALYPLRQLLLARIILRLTPADLDHGIAQRHDPWLGAAEGLFYVLAALCLAAGW